MESNVMARIDAQGAMKVNGVELSFDTSRMHETWVKRVLAYGVKQLVNDTYSGERGELKYSLCSAMLEDMMSGKPLEEKARKTAVTGGTDPIRKLARDKATTFLAAGLVAKFGKDMSIWAAQPQLKGLFRFTDKGAARFDLAAVDQWMEGPIKVKRDFMAEAAEELSHEGDVSLDDLGL